AANYYNTAFANHPQLTTPVTAKNSTHVFHQYTLVLKDVDRVGLQNHLAAKDIPAMIYYPVPLHLQKAYIDSRYKAGDFPCTEALCASVVSLPMHSELNDEQLKFITESVLEFLNK
ncbi:MAG: DegT/DnrJ/EryC1/StrS family aminotransferase, partial [Bacteroidales bacterium]